MKVDLFRHRYYNINRMLLKLTGQWPYQSARSRYVHVAIILLIAASQMIPQTIAIVKHRHDWDFLIDCAAPLMFNALCLTKVFYSVINSNKMLKLLNRIRANWDIWGNDRDCEVIHAYAEKGRNLTVLYTVAAYATCVISVTQPIFPKIIDNLFRNGTAPCAFPTPVDYLQLDTQKYYLYIIFHNLVTASMAFLYVIAYDSLFMVYVQHACGLYAVLGKKLERIGRTEGTTDELKKRDVSCEELALCIERHKEAIEFSKLIEASYSWCFFFIAGFNMFMIVMTGLQFIRTNDHLEAAKIIVGNVIAMLHFVNQSYMAQMLMDHSISIRFCILNSEWYTLPVKAQKLLQFMIMRCAVPSSLTAGKFFIMSMQSFTVFLKTTQSYFMLLRSF